MKDFIHRVFVLSALVIFFVVLLCTLYQGIIFKESLYRKMPAEIRIAAVGNSHAAMSYTFFGSGYFEGNEYLNCFNFGFPSQSYYYDYKLINHYIGHFNDNSVLILDASIYKLYIDEFEDTGLWEKNFRYYPVLTTKEMRFSKPIDKIKGYFQLLYKVNSDIGNIFTVSNYNKEDVQTTETENILLSENLNDLKSILDLCRKKNIKAVLVTTPYMESYRDNDNDEFYRIMKELTEEYDIEYWDYSDLYKDDSGLFLDENHLNTVGAEEFTKLITERLKKK